jgi:hypothetical protein
MTKWLLLFSLLFPLILTAQTTSLTATITDSTSTVWVAGTYSIQFVPVPNMPNNYSWQGAKFVPQKYTGTMNGSGTFSVTLPDNNTITPARTQWQFTLCSNTSAPCSTIITPITGASENLSTFFSSRVTAPTIFAAAVPRAYSSNEVAPPPLNQGGEFFRVTNNLLYLWTGSAWISFGGSGCIVSGFANQIVINSGSVSCLASTATADTSGNINTPGSVTAGSVNGLTNAATLTGSDIGAQINGFGPIGALWIPEGTYNFSTPISITQAAGNNLHITCASRNSILNFTGSGDAIFVNGGQSPTAQFDIENCQLTGTGSATHGIHLFDTQNSRLTNLSISGFSAGAGVYGEGSLLGMFVGDDLIDNQYGEWLAPDTTNSFASTRNSTIGGSMQYNTGFNFWDEGNSSAYGGDTSNTLDGVTMEESANVPQFLVEGTWNDAITNSYLEYISFTTSTADLFNGIVGNITGSGYGSNTTYTAANFTFENNYLITPAKGIGFTTASLLAENTAQLLVENVTDEGAATYGIDFNAFGTNSSSVVGPNQMQWITAEFLNPPADGNLWAAGGTPTLSGWNGTANGLKLNTILPNIIAGNPDVSEGEYIGTPAGTVAGTGIYPQTHGQPIYWETNVGSVSSRYCVGTGSTIPSTLGDCQLTMDFHGNIYNASGNMIIPYTATLPYVGAKVIAGTSAPTDPCSATDNTFAIEINATPTSYQCSNATGSYAWNAL